MKIKDNKVKISRYHLDMRAENTSKEKYTVFEIAVDDNLVPTKHIKTAIRSFNKLRDWAQKNIDESERKLAIEFWKDKLIDGISELDAKIIEEELYNSDRNDKDSDMQHVGI